MVIFRLPTPLLLETTPHQREVGSETRWFRPVGASRQRPTNRRAAGGTPCRYSRDRGGGFTELPEDTEGVSFVTVICRYTEAFILMTENGSLPVSHVTVLAGTPVALTL